MKIQQSETLEQVRIGENRVPLLDVASIETVENAPEDIVQYNGNNIVYRVIIEREDVPSVSENVEAVVMWL